MKSLRPGWTRLTRKESGPELLLKQLEGLKAENALLNKQVEYLGNHVGIDHLTGASNRSVFEHELEHALKVIRGEIVEHRSNGEVAKEISLIFVDLDHFKQINDTYGHPIGDEVLKRVSALLVDSVRETDMVARVGGEEFVVLLRGADETFAAHAAEKFRAKIEQLSFPSTPGLTLTASFGVCSSQTSTDAKKLYGHADKALYHAKHGGRNRVVIHGKYNA